MEDELRALDAEVAKAFWPDLPVEWMDLGGMGEEPPQWCMLHENGDEWIALPRFSSEIAAAWTVVERLRAEGQRCVVYVRAPTVLPGKPAYSCMIGDNEARYGHNAPLAISRASLSWARGRKEDRKTDSGR